MQIIFLPPSIDKQSLPDSVSLEDPNKFLSCQSISIRRTFKSSEVVAYAIEWDEPLPSVSIPSKVSSSASSSSFVACETQLSTACGFRAQEALAVVSSQQTDAIELRKLYRQLSFTPLDEVSNGSLKAAVDECLVNVFGVIVGVGEVTELPVAAEKTSNDIGDPVKRASVPVSLVSVVDFDASKDSAVQIRLWRRLAPWVRSLVPGDVVQLRGLRCSKDAGSRLVPLQSTTISEIFLLAHGPRSLEQPSELRLPLSARQERLSAGERTIVEWLRNQSLQLYSKHSDLGEAYRHSARDGCAVSGLLVEVRRSASVSAAWNVTVLTDPGSLATVVFADLDAQTWCLLMELTSGKIGRRMRFGRLSPLLEFVHGRSEFALGSAEAVPSVYLGSPLNVAAVLTDSLLVFGCLLVSGVLEEMCLETGSGFSSSEYSLVTSQPNRLVLKDLETEAYLPLEGAAESAVILGAGTFRVVVGAVAAAPDSAALLTRTYRLEHVA